MAKILLAMVKLLVEIIVTVTVNGKMYKKLLVIGTCKTYYYMTCQFFNHLLV